CAFSESSGLVLRKSADDKHTVAIRSEWRQDRRQLEAGALTLGCPVVDPFEVSRNAVRTVNEAESLNRRRRVLSPGQRRCHRAQQRQTQHRSCAAQKSTAGKSLLSD